MIDAVSRSLRYHIWCAVLDSGERERLAIQFCILLRVCRKLKRGRLCLWVMTIAPSRASSWLQLCYEDKRRPVWNDKDVCVISAVEFFEMENVKTRVHLSHSAVVVPPISSNLIGYCHWYNEALCVHMLSRASKVRFEVYWVQYYSSLFQANFMDMPSYRYQYSSDDTRLIFCKEEFNIYTVLLIAFVLEWKETH